MKDEIKEIDRIIIINVKRKLQFSPERRFVELFNKDEINKLLDCITNLQSKTEKIEKVNNYISKVKPKMYKCHNKPAIYILSDIEKIIGGK